MEQNPRPRSLEVPLPHRPTPPRSSPRIRRRRNPRRRQTDPRVTRLRPADGGRALFLSRRLGRQTRSCRSRSQARATRRHRPSDPMEFPSPDAGMENRASPRHRQHSGDQARRNDIDHRAEVCIDPARCRTPTRCGQHRHRRSRNRRAGGQSPTSRKDCFHRIDRCGKNDPTLARRHRQKTLARTRWQSRQHRLRRRADRSISRRCDQWHLFQSRPCMLRRIPPARAGRHRRSIHSTPETPHGHTPRW